MGGTDYSDAPISGTGTNNYGTAIHNAVSSLKLGANIDSETASIANADASGDGTDDDGITIPNLIAGATTYSIPAVNIIATGTGTLHAWIDFNKNGTFEAGEYKSVAVNSNTPASALSWSGITIGSVGNTFARFRFTTDATVTSATPSGNASNGEVEDYQVSIGSPADVLLLKRITAINGLTTNPNDNTTSLTGVLVNPNWKAGYVVGATNGGKVKPGDTIEYTIYYLNNGGRNAKSARICDRLNANQSFQQNTYTTGAGMQIQIGGDRITNTAVNLTNQSGDDGGRFIAANTALPTNCNLTGITNDYGALILDLAGTTSAPVFPTLTNLPNTTGQGTPNNSFGFWRFITKVNKVGP